MASTYILLFPFMAQGHMIPMIDLAKLLAHHGFIITIVTTPHNADRYHSVLARATHSGLQIHVALLPFPSTQVGLPEGCENLDLLPLHLSSSMSAFCRATSLLYEPSEKLLQQLCPRPSCIISDMCLPWTLRLAQNHQIPRLVFYSLSCFFLLCMRSLKTNHSLVTSISDSEFLTLSDLPDPVEIRKSQLSRVKNEEMGKLSYEMVEADRLSHGVILNVFEEMEAEYVAEYRKNRDLPQKVWCVGPLSLCNDNKLDKAERGEKSSIHKDECIKWLNGQQPSSVVYVSMGSLCNLSTPQLVELGLGLEASKKPFIWVIRKGNLTEELQRWIMEYDFERKTERWGLVIRGWAPQVAILSHSAIGGFLTHCGWNSSIEGIAAGVPMITWPLFADQVFNAKLIVEVLKVGVSVGEETALHWGEEAEKEVMVKREEVREAIERVMDGENKEEMKQRSKKLAEMAKRAVEEGGSSHRNLKRLIEEIV
ncbi:hypothetical protein IC575_010105 [Cucumis melo]|uniref:Glycosyltransferase n=1 Tax=Cucumis melo TaxID=3656 RepID=A0A1S3B6F6_CUCME|nr:UDP-glycosyltransferase 73C3-like [Cucumis melo]